MIRFLQGPCSLFQHHFFPPFPLFLSLQLHILFLLFWWLCYTNGKSKYFLCSLLYPQWLTYRAYQTYKTGSILYFERSSKSKIYIFIFYIQIHLLSYWIYSCFFSICTLRPDIQEARYIKVNIIIRLYLIGWL